MQKRGVLDADGAMRVESLYCTHRAKLLGVATPEDIVGVASGTEKTAAALGLPSTVDIATEAQGKRPAVTWDLDELAAGTYDPASPAEQAFKVRGTVSLPEEVANPDNMPLEVIISVQVLRASAGDHGQADDKVTDDKEDIKEVPHESVAAQEAGHDNVDDRYAVGAAAAATNKIVLPEIGDDDTLQPLAVLLLALGMTLGATAGILKK